MTDDELIEGFENCTLAGKDFHHQDHVRVVWIYLHSNSVIQTLEKFSAGLKRLAIANGKPNLYHETITWAYVLLINERMQRQDTALDWVEFVETNPDVFDWKNNILKSYYQDETLRSETARRIFLLPDKIVKGT